MPQRNQDKAKDLVDQYLKLLNDQKALQSQIDELKQTIAKFSQGCIYLPHPKPITKLLISQ